MRIAGYQLGEVIYAVDETVVASATDADGRRVVLKYLDSTRPAPELVARWRHEFSVLQAIDSGLVIKALELTAVERNLMLVLEDFASTSLAQLIERGLLDLSDQLTLALRLARALGEVHEHRIIHGDIAPKNVLVDAASLEIKLCDFGLSTRLDVQPRLADGAALSGTLDYMSPEQTGRTNLDVDYRSDFYSLGATLYELFSGRRPFLASDPMSLLHAQLASRPVPLHDLDPAIPEPLSAVVQKLLSKHPDDRYQSSYGLLHDLEACAEQWRLYQRIEPFPLAARDVPERFCVAQKLYGRQAEYSALLAAFKRVSSGTVEVALVSGYPGIGKTALVNELHRPVVSRRGYLLRGKCDQYGRNQPYSALSQAFGQMLQTLATESAERRHYWRGRLIDALGANAAAVLDIVPQLTLLIGTPPALPELPPAEREQRLHIAFGQFVSALAQRNHPLLVFLDDLQWADLPTLRLIELLARAHRDCALLLIGAYRDNALQPGDPLSLSVQSLGRAQARVEHLRLGPLPDAEATQMVADSLHCPRSQVQPLADLCLSKTRGNPFFLSQFLRRLHELGDIHYDRDHGAWRWELERIRGRDMTDNVVVLLLDKLNSLPVDTRNLLANAAHLGNRFDQLELMAVGEHDAETTASVLWPALQAGLLVPLNEEYKFAHSPERLQRARYRFLHDRVQQAAHELVPEEQRIRTRLLCGRRLLAASGEAELDERLFVILESLNPALGLMDDPAERERLLDLNLRGGIRAKSASAFGAAVEFLRHGVSLLPADAWQSNPERTLSLHRHLAEAEYLAGHFDAAEARLERLIEAAPGAAAKASFCLVQADQLHIRGRFEEALGVLRRALDLIGRHFPDNEDEALQCFLQEFGEVETSLARYDEASLLALPEMQDPLRQLEMQVYFGLAYSTYQTDRGNSYVLGACRMVATTLKHGQCDLTSIALVTFVTAMAACQRPYPDCHAMGVRARTLAERRDNPYFKLSVYQYFSGLYQHWCDPLRATLPYLEEGLAMGQSGINPLAAGYCALFRPVNSFLMGRPLDEVELEAEQGLSYLQGSRQPITETMLRCAVLQPVAALRGQTQNPRSFDSAEISIARLIGDDPDAPSIARAYYVSAMIRHAYLFGAAEVWRECVPRVPMIAKMLPDGPNLVEALFFQALGLLHPDFGDAGEKASDIDAAQKLLERFQLWAEHCPTNFRHKALLISAEMARARGEHKVAMELFAEAIDAAGESGFAHCEGLANELYARFWTGQQQRQLASNFIREAYYHYQHWGATAKLRQLEAQWPQIAFRTVELRRSNISTSASYRDVSASTGLLDLQSLLKASRLLSQEVKLDSLLQKMLAVMLENAGAGFGAIVSVDEDALVAEAVGHLESGNVVGYQRLDRPLGDGAREAESLLPVQLFKYVLLTRSVLVLSQPADDLRFGQSRYLKEHRPRAVLLLPVVSQGRLVAMVYLENRLLEGAFTERHVKTLELIGAQAAISLINARLYESLERKVAQRTEELRQMSMKDGLTGIANRRSFDERLASEWRRSQRSGQPLSLMMIDIDHFKLFNDHYGHVEGDRCIRAVAQTLERVINRSADLVARYGGEEFAVVMPDTDRAAAIWLARACLAGIAELDLPHEHSSAARHVSISIGLCTAVADGEQAAEQLVTRADRALYEAKRAGRNLFKTFD
ncbi:diguanylate cyclase domain-containing protein [Pseudomarimonas salicorniae]|uniref:Diguanylate cyclase n=1 Tax=Pseudomarimonas salicorniae TaxID=2933270 RepID=A0ABT0GG26_9GAMM|nr:diguanylate cyclase [Lysobacter sp. CAU 1642]